MFLVDESLTVVTLNAEECESEYMLSIVWANEGSKNHWQTTNAYKCFTDCGSQE